MCDHNLDQLILVFVILRAEHAAGGGSGGLVGGGLAGSAMGLSGFASASGRDESSRCRYCGVGSGATPVIDGVCGDKECVSYANNACTLTLGN